MGSDLCVARNTTSQQYGPNGPTVWLRMYILEEIHREGFHELASLFEWRGACSIILFSLNIYLDVAMSSHKAIVIS